MQWSRYIQSADKRVQSRTKSCNTSMTDLNRLLILWRTADTLVLCTWWYPQHVLCDCFWSLNNTVSHWKTALHYQVSERQHNRCCTWLLHLFLINNIRNGPGFIVKDHALFLRTQTFCFVSGAAFRSHWIQTAVFIKFHATERHSQIIRWLDWTSPSYTQSPDSSHVMQSLHSPQITSIGRQIVLSSNRRGTTSVYEEDIDDVYQSKHKHDSRRFSKNEHVFRTRNMCWLWSCVKQDGQC